MKSEMRVTEALLEMVNGKFCTKFLLISYRSKILTIWGRPKEAA